MKGRLVVLGDVLLDRDVLGTTARLCPDAPVPVLDETGRVDRPGGAGLAAALAASDGRSVTLVTALADDGAGRELAALLGEAGIEVIAARLALGTPEKIRFRSHGRSLMRWDRYGPPAPMGPFPADAHRAVAEAGVVLISDYGRRVTADEALRDTVAGFRGPTVWDPHPRGSMPVRGMSLVTPNRSELLGWFPDGGEALTAVAEGGRRACARWSSGAVAVTLGPAGALLVTGEGPPLVVPTEPVEAGDPCGAGDRFAATVAGCLLDGALVSEAVIEAVSSATRFVGRRVDGPGPKPAQPKPGRPETRAQRPADPSPGAHGLARRTRAGGGTVVVAGGCFDLLHAGHVSLLQAARRLGDCLIVAVNSDASVRRLKGAGRPVVPEHDRVAVLTALGCVDAVIVFDEPSPVGVLEALRPHVFVKGGDYSGRDLPEAAVLARWGGQAVVVPYLSGRSTTGLLRQATGPV